VGFKVADQVDGIVSDVTKEDGLTTFTEEQETIEDLEEFGRGLMDPITTTLGDSNLKRKKENIRAENSLSSVGQSPQERNDSPGRLRIKTGGGFIQEE
jgi:hypothetical protein